MNQTLKRTLTKLIVETQMSWVQCLPLALLKIRTQARSDLGVSPYEMMFGLPFLTTQHENATYEVLLTTEAAIRTKERGWIHASRIKGPVDEPKEWTITSEPGDTKLTLKRGLSGNELGRPKWSKKHTQDHT
ncbi:hypothetical protein DUI87_20806 [Hirundo rustica rustica]|uniref:Uncharacterized protein n=1 Tax=Hirundo rustica rustica TaxID=333673 RepID=A0A3M0JQU2_HIRRU|nr:hypothetical protein DUI87_20806 [Hirundo rustica rustica]